ncbi:MAG: hypothetical protein HXS52_03030 [Theionarchaea archaeon]|nr:hypothetical protein [Theionarchaea archaeon]MBU7036880.1 hypothetical protein [Theionarchaea archaeon]
MEAHQLDIVYAYVQYCSDTKEVRYSKFHKWYKPYNRKQSTFRLLNRAVEEKIIFPPRIFCIQKVKVNLVEHKEVPLVDQFEKISSQEDTFYAVLLLGAHSLLYFSASDTGTNLTYSKCIFPSYPPKKEIQHIDPCLHEPRKLPCMAPPDWSSFDWEVFQKRRDPTESSIKIGGVLGVSHRRVLNSYKRILGDCSVWIPFFPKGYGNYTPYFVSFETDYETGVVEELKKIDRSSYVYRIDDTMLLNLFFERRLEIDSMLQLEKKGIIHDLRVSSPMYSFERFQSQQGIPEPGPSPDKV